MPRPLIKFDNRRVHGLLRRHPTHPEAHQIILDTIVRRPARRLSGNTLVSVLTACPTITTKAVDDATGRRLGRSACMEYAALAREASAGITEYLRRERPQA